MRALLPIGQDVSAEIVPGASLADLDPAAIATAKQQLAVKHPSQANDIQGHWRGDYFEIFNVNSKNCTELSNGTVAWIA